MVIDYGNQVIPWYDSPILGATNFTWQPIPANPPADEIQKYIANKQYQQKKNYYSHFISFKPLK